MKYPIRTLSEVQVSQIVKALLLIGETTVKVDKKEDGRYQISTSSSGR